MQNSRTAPNERISISDIKEQAKEDAHMHVIDGISAILLLKAARNQCQVAQANEDQGDLKGALSALLKAGSLAAMVMNSKEFTGESRPGKYGLLYKEFINFHKVYGPSHMHTFQLITSLE